jgi:ATP-dependent Lhr-like helicase
LAKGYSPSNSEELLQWVKERIYIPAQEWEELLVAIQKDHAIDPSILISEITDRLYLLKKESLLTAVIALENLPRISHALELKSAEAQRVAFKLKLEDIFNQDSSVTFHQFLGEWLSFYGPISQKFLSTIFQGIEEKIAQSLKSLHENGDIVVDEFREDSPIPSDSKRVPVNQEICDTKNLEILYRIQRSQQQPVVDPKEIDALPLFLATFQGLTAPGDSVQDLQNCLEFLFGYPAKASLWETDILPARLAPYYNSWLDTVMRDNDLLWFGCGTERLSFCFNSDIELFLEKHSSSFKEETLKIKNTLEESKGKFTFDSMVDLTNLSSEHLSNSLWNLAWKGQVTNDDFSTLRKGVLNRFRIQKANQVRKRRGRYTYNRWKSERPFLGNWYALNLENLESMDALDRQELVKDRIRQLARRFGILFREILANELPILKWSKIFPVLRLMELSGELLSGHFFKGLPGLQFCTPQALNLLKKRLPQEAVYWMNATDPASLCGIDIHILKNKLPPRLPTTHLVFQGQKLVLISKRNGKELIINIKPSHPNFLKSLDFFKILLTRDFSPLTYISIDTINQKPVLESEYKNGLQEFGFKKDFKSMILLKSYDL